MARKPVPISFSDWERNFADLPPAVMKNRIFEKNPSQAQGVAMLARWGTDDFGSFGTGPIRGFYSDLGLFNGALFVVSGDTMYRRDTDGTIVTLNGTVYGSGSVSIAGAKGADYERIFVADGSHLQLYQGGSHATGALTGSAHVADGDTIQIGDTWYEWTATITNGAGTSANPWKVKIGATLAEDLTNMVNAISFVGVPGTDFSANLGGQDPNVTATTTATVMTVTAISDQADGNSIATTVAAGGSGNVAWGAATLSGGGIHGLSGVEVPDGLPPIFLATLKSYVVVFIADTDKFFYITPGSIVINALDFATAESHPDKIIAGKTVGDTLVIVGANSIEVWYVSQDTTNPLKPITGRTYDMGAIEGSVATNHGVLYFVSPENVVYAMEGQPVRISNHGVEELVRLTLEAS